MAASIQVLKSSTFGNFQRAQRGLDQVCALIFAVALEVNSEEQHLSHSCSFWLKHSCPGVSELKGRCTRTAVLR